MKALQGNPQRANRVIGGAILLVAVLLAYLPALRAGFIWDDDRHVVENRMLHDLRGLKRLWFEPGVTPQYYPLTHTSFWIEHRLWGANPAGYHVTNILLHAVNAILVWLLLRRLDVPGAFLAAAVFALHPVNVETVAWVSERKNLLAAGFMLGSILAYLRFNFSGYALSLALFAAALLSKTIACSTPAVILLLLWWKRKLTWKEVALVAPMFILGAVLARVTVQMEVQHVGARGPEWDLALAQRFIIAGRAIWFYVSKLLWPAQLTFSYPRWEVNPRDPWQWVPMIAVIAAVAALAVAAARGRLGRGPLAAVLIFIGTLFPALGFFDTYPMRYSFVADHFVYISSIAFIALIIGAIATAFDRWLQRPRIDAIRARFVVANGALLLCILGVLTFRQARVYHDSQALWRDTIRKNPDSWMARNNLGVLLTHAGAADLAAGRDAEGRRKLEEALRLLEDAEQSHPEPRKVRFNRAEALVKLGRYDQAMQLYEQELSADPHDPRVITQLGNALAQMNRPDAAEQRFRRAIELDGQLIEPRFSLAKLLEQRDRFDAAIEQYEQVLQIKPNEPRAHLELALLLYRPQINRLADAARHLEKYLELSPRDADARATLGFVYGEMSRYREAREQFARALELEANHPAAQRGMQLLSRPTTATAPSR